ncbi:ABC transporter family protein [Paraburkholderia xenovorans LB400]|jgi:lipopolysaccharide transport system ATP-binding protein|uniref:ABC O-antigen/lipopolysaccharide exporter, ATPase subunit n=1 Tax=Paraburkholderia xenovorans (strain LB400) TaxID=266265 RepID=Q144N9_PARXL|nr:ABC transporter ATP-binding protein [Paraburkholderia xenovorans]ABE29200.1 ABC O-antigen/lipopolysaccharide exporter, ATPase subunit [Paraburkholderia xenovorans LB400]AIP30660.1 ABC transporter family protein [Paraburkholderia xenovorans LB400]
MSSEIVIRVKNLSKCFNIYDQPRDRLKQAILPRLQRLFGRPQKSYHKEFWALRNADFEIRRGETVGIIGRNGSGKSTLLQLLCGTLTPTHGDIEVTGKVAALLELGAGFNPEFTGRENVFLSGSFYGLTREQVQERFDRIAAFADIGDHIEQPVKTYSSGMFVRLAFAVIAHVDADILVIDEALSVGDAVFTQKCMRFIRSFQEKGTLLFVSHDMQSVVNLCRNAIWLNAGETRMKGTSKNVSEAYLKYTLQEVYGEEAILLSAAPKESTLDAPMFEEAGPPMLDYEAVASVSSNLFDAKGWKTGDAEIEAVQLESLTGENDGILRGGELVRMVVRARAHQPLERPVIGFMVRDRLGQNLFGENTLSLTALDQARVAAGQMFEGEFVFRLPMLPDGQYSVTASVADGDLHNNVQHHLLHDALIINVASSKVRWGLVGVPFERVTLNCI